MRNMTGIARSNAGWRSWALVTAALLVSACGGGTKYRAVSDTPVRIGPPYVIRGVTHVPRPDPLYDAMGFASWYGSESGNQTANGERFRPGWATAAHRTLPLPTYVEVTALDTGRTILVRVNDRGPFARGRIIDLSRGAAEALGMRAAGHGAVRVRRVEPDERDRERLRKGKGVAERRPVPAPVLEMWRAEFAAGLATGAIEGR